MRQGKQFVIKPLHDPTAEFAIVLYDPTIDDPALKPKEEKPEEAKKEEDEQPKEELDRPVMHKSLAEILGLRKEVKEEVKQVPVVIDPRLAKVLRPHQVEGVKVQCSWSVPCIRSESLTFRSFYTVVRRV